jgi:hypothetical protein
MSRNRTSTRLRGRKCCFRVFEAAFNLAESYYLSLPYLSWQNIVIGDPLVSPFGSAPQTADQAGTTIDPETDLPAFVRRAAAGPAQVDETSIRPASSSRSKA